MMEERSLKDTIDSLKIRYSMTLEEIREYWNSYCWHALKYELPNDKEFHVLVVNFIDQSEILSFDMWIRMWFLKKEVGMDEDVFMCYM